MATAILSTTAKSATAPSRLTSTSPVRTVADKALAIAAKESIGICAQRRQSLSASIEQRVISIVREIISDHSVRPATDDIPLNACLIDDLGFDFADEMNFMCEAETIFGIELPDDPLRCDTTVADLIRMVEGALREKVEARS